MPISALLQKHSNTLFLGGIILCAFGLLVTGITYGFPVSFHADENGIVKTALRLPVDRFDPHAYYHPSLTYYVLLVPIGLLYIVISLWNGNFSPHLFGLYFFEKPHFFFFTARLFTALLFCCTVYLLFLSLKKVVSKNRLIFGISALFAFNPALIENHHYALTDSVGICTTALALLYFLSLEKINYTSSLYSGLLAGLALSAKFNALFIPCMYVLFFLLDRKKEHNIFFIIGIFGASAATVFIVLNPYFFINFQQAVSEVQRQGEVLKTAGPVNIVQSIAAPLVLLSDSFNPVVFLLMLCSVFRALLRPGDTKMFCLGLYVCMGFMFFSRYDRYPYIRYYFPLFLPLYLLVAVFLENSTVKYKRLARLGIFIIFISFSLSAIQSFRDDLHLLEEKPETAAHKWVLNNIASRKKILTNIHKLHLPETPEYIQKRLHLAELHNTYKRTYYKYLYEASLRATSPRYEVQFFMEKATYAQNTVKLDEFYASEDALDKKELIADQSLMQKFDYLIVDAGGREGFTLDGAAQLLKSFDNIMIYKLNR